MKNVADVAHEFGCEQLVFVSSDKAVRPANVMGTTKLIGEHLRVLLGARNGLAYL